MGKGSGKRGSKGASASQLDVALRLTVSKWGDPSRLLTSVATHAAAAEGFTGGTLSIAVVGAKRMASIHERFLNISGPTDVITFDLDTDPQRGWLEGEVVVCADVAARHAGTKRKAVHHELALYVVHGILHLAGYDDHDPQDYEAMHAREDEILTSAGLGRVFAG